MDARVYTEEDTAALSVTKLSDAPLARRITLENAVLHRLTQLRFNATIEREQEEPNWFVQQRSRLSLADVVLKRADGRLIAASRVKSFKFEDGTANIELKPGTFASAEEARGLQLATKPYFNISAGAGIPVQLEH
jgi:hypothetical protein